jgi:hypothetical protein
MEVRSNVRAASQLRVTGTHTFDQQIDYHVSIPLLPGLLRRTTSSTGGVTGPNLLLAIQGTEDSFRVSYDRGRAQANRATISPARRPEASPGTIDRTATPASSAKPTEPRKLFEVKKPPEKKPAQPQPGEYFSF